jgi:tetratricopeptide (TPR) repeat protein
LKIKDDPMLGHRRAEMLLQMADCYVRLGELEDASRSYREVLPEAIDPEHAELAAYRLAEVEFFRGDIDSALTLFQDMAEAYPRSLRADDAAGRYILLNKYQSVGGGVALELLGRMEWGRQVGDSAAVDSTATLILENWGGGELGAEAYLGLADIAERSGRYEQALDYLEKLVAAHAGDRRAPTALQRQGDILAGKLHRPEEALRRYEAVLADYPTTVQAGDVRRALERLRRDIKS